MSESFEKFIGGVEWSKIINSNDNDIDNDNDLDLDLDNDIEEPPQDMDYEDCKYCGAQHLVYLIDPTHNKGYCSDWCHQQDRR